MEPRLEGEQNGVLEGVGEKQESGAGQFEEQAKASIGLLNRLKQGRGEGSNDEVIGSRENRDEGSPSAKGNQGELESRLAELETLIGANQADLDEVSCITVSPPKHQHAELVTIYRILHIRLRCFEPSHDSTTS